MAQRGNPLRCPSCGGFGSNKHLDNFCKNCNEGRMGKFYVVRDSYYPHNGFHQGEFISKDGYGYTDYGIKKGK